MQTDPESTPRKAGFRAEQINVVTPTAPAVGSMQGSTPHARGAWESKGYWYQQTV